MKIPLRYKIFTISPLFSSHFLPDTVENTPRIPNIYPSLPEISRSLSLYLSFFRPVFLSDGKRRRGGGKTHGKRGFYERDFDEINPENDESPGQALFSSISLWGKGGEFYGGLAMERR